MSTTSIRIRVETLRQLHQLRKHPAETIDSVVSRLIARYRGEPEPPILLWGHVHKRKPVIRCKKLHAIARKKRSAKDHEDPILRFY
jgi:hypothetical protein